MSPDPLPLDARPGCFVVMPFGTRSDGQGGEIDFDAIHERFIRPTAEAAGLDSVRCDELDEAGSIHQRMFEHLADAEVAVVDLSLLNPNVFYELGVRHTLMRNTTVLIRRAGTSLPFNLGGQDVVEYPADIATAPDSPAARRAAEAVLQRIRNGMASLRADSPICRALDAKVSVQRRVQILAEGRRWRWALPDGAPGAGRGVGVVTGDLRYVKGIDAWVNSENTDMQMARFHDLSVSGLVRYLGARRNAAGKVKEDTIALALAEATEGEAVAPATAIATTAGELAGLNGVRRLVHVATVAGELGRGYRVVADLGTCVRNALDCLDQPLPEHADIRSVLFPLLGTGTARADLEDKARQQIGAAIAHLRERPGSRLQTVYFLCPIRPHLDACRRLLGELLPGGPTAA